MFFHGNNMPALHNHIPATHLPKDYGGEQPEIDYSGADWYPTMLTVENKIKGKFDEQICPFELLNNTLAHLR